MLTSVWKHYLHPCSLGLIQITFSYILQSDQQRYSQGVYTDNGSPNDFYYSGSGLFSLYPEAKEN